jgi:L,D-peptidoglycan transpeptidase YkuD (ErfK/YbiS/YcfS/YnhG family)
MAWGIGPFAGRPLSGPVKVEGDGRSPAGIFELGDAFGYSKTPPSGCRLPYRNITELDYYIDDPESNDYNSWVRLQPETNFPQRRWRSFERMKLESDAYELGIIVKHNMDPAIPGKGSAIFLHLWGGPDHPTAACTAMSRKNFLRLLRWLDPAKRPVLIQVPEPELVSASGRWHYRR